MKPGIRYIVTRASKNREFQAGDRVRLEDDGSISNFKLRCWMPAEDVPPATEGWAIEPDREWVERRRAALQRQLDEIGGV